jgi:uncharacterized protein YkwD
LQIGRLVDTKLSAHSLTQDGKPIEYCAFDAPSYRNGNATAQEYGRWNLRAAGAVAIVPREPLQPGSHYSVSITAHDNTYAWSFTVAEAGAATTFTPIAKFPTLAPMPLETASPQPRRAARPSHRASPASMTTPAPTEAASGTASTSSNWLTALNGYRTHLNLPEVSEDSTLSRGCLAHAKYLMTNYDGVIAHGGQLGALFHAEDESKPAYSAEGLKAAQSSDVIHQPRNNLTDDQLMAEAIQRWISGPFHRAQLVNPELKQVGFGQYCNAARCVSALDSVSDSPVARPSGRPLAEPVKVPPDGASVKPSRFGGEWPSPVSSCAGYSAFSSAITLQLGMFVHAKIGAGSLTQTTGADAGKTVATCTYDSEGYTNPDPVAQNAGRKVLSAYGEVVMMVRDPLATGETYRVAMTVNGTPYRWSFTAAP